ncbi:MAG TPA: RNA methyltransferase [Myxococcaceae bacterium]|nr:RNA methyltransferase [Myxococcaceae bacterium]
MKRAPTGGTSSRPAPAADTLLLPPRREKVDAVVARRLRGVTVVLDQLEDTFNMAAVLRSCEAFGLQDVHVVENPDVPFAPHDKVTQGCDKWLDVHRHKSFAACARALRLGGYRICVSAVREDAHSVFELEFDRPRALVFGNERTGVTPDALAAADEAFWIPMRGFTRSLNVSAAVSATLSRVIGWRLDHGKDAGDLPEAETRALRDRFYALSVKQRKRLFGR